MKHARLWAMIGCRVRKEIFSTKPNDGLSWLKRISTTSTIYQSAPRVSSWAWRNTQKGYTLYTSENNNQKKHPIQKILSGKKTIKQRAFLQHQSRICNAFASFENTVFNFRATGVARKFYGVLIFAEFADWCRSAKISYRRIKRPEKKCRKN